MKLNERAQKRKKYRFVWQAASGISRSNIKFGLITHAAAVGALHHEYKLSQHIQFYHTLRNARCYNINLVLVSPTLLLYLTTYKDYQH